MLEFCESKIKNIKFYEINFQNNRFSIGVTVTGTRSFHHFIRVSNTQISFKRTSEDVVIYGAFSFTQSKNADCEKLNDIKLADNVACTYDQFWWIGLVDHIDEANKDVKVKFLHPHGPAKPFCWPNHEDVCWVPFTNIITILNAPTTSGRVYQITDEEYENMKIL